MGINATHSSVPFRSRFRAPMVVAATALILIARRPFALLHPQLFAEDGIVFWNSDYQRGWHAIFEEYAGYLHLTPRIVAWISGWFDPLHAPARLYAGALLVHLAVVAILFSRRVPLPCKPILAVLTALVPHTGEVFTNVTNIQWPLALGQVLLLIAAEPETALQQGFDLGAMVLMGLTGPFSIFFAPAFVLRALHRRTRAGAALAATCVATAGLQAWELVHDLPMHGNASAPWVLAKALANRAWAVLFGGFRLGEPGEPAFWLVVGAVGTMVFVGLMVRRGPWREARITLLVCWLLLMGSVAVKFIHEPEAILSPVNGDRYFYLPHVLALWGLVLVFAGMQSRWRWAPLVAVAAAVGMGWSQFVEPPRPITPWASEMPLVRAGKPFSIPTLPEGMDIPSPGKPAR